MLDRTIKLSKKHSFFLFGARGTGKTTLLKSRFLDSQTIHIDLLRSKPYTELSLDPGTIRNLINGKPDTHRVIIDEIQRVPALLNEVHALIEERPTIQFILTGSSSRKLKRGGANLLAGRAYVYNLHPFTSTELSKDFDLDSALQWGMLPRLLALPDDEDRLEFLRAYATTYLREEVLQEQLIRKLEPFQRFLPVAAQVSGKALNYAKISRDVGVAPVTVETYFHLLADTLIGYFLPAYHPSVRKQERRTPKFLLFDTGVQRALAGHLEASVRPRTSVFGELFEQFVIQEIVKRSSYIRRDDRFCYYQSEGGREVDLVIERPIDRNILLEIKSTERVTEDHTRHLQALATDLPDALFYCFSLDRSAKQFDKVRCLHWQAGLREIGLE